MNILTAIRREQRKLEKRVGKLQGRLRGLKAAANLSATLKATNWAGAGARPVSSRKGEDFRRCETTVGEGESRGEEGGELKIARLVKWSRTCKL